MVKIGTLTLHYPYNYGSALQAFALQKELEHLGYDSENYKIFRFHQYFKRPKTMISDLVYLRKNLKRRRAFKAFTVSHLKVTKKRYRNSHNLEQLNNCMDAFIVGSDQVWNFECTGGVDLVYFLNFVDSKHKKIAYAPSMGQSDQSERDLKTIKPMLEAFDELSVREKSKQSELERLVDRKFEVVLDPTLLLSRRDYIPLMTSEKEEEYIFVYLLEPNEELVQYATNLAQRSGLKVVYISNITKKQIFKTVASENVYGVGPDEFLTKLHGARYVVTNSFHATIFSILFKKKFVTFKTKKSFPRMLDLLKRLGLEDRIMSSNFSMDKDIDFNSVDELLENLKKKSILFLRDALSKID